MKKRKLFQELLRQKDKKKISLIIGARQVGKTTLLKGLYDHICGSLNKNGLFLDLDIFTNFEKVSSFENLLNTLKLNGYKEDQKEFFYLFLDEFQRYSGISIVLKNVHDNFNNIKIYASGSSSLRIKNEIQESLAGRKQINLLYPLDFEEFLWFKEDEKAIEEFNNAGSLSGENLNKSTSRLNELLSEFLIFGGYPEVVLMQNKKEKIEILESIFDLYVKRDLVEYLRVEKILNAKKLIEYLAINHGQKIKYDEISQLCSLNHLYVKQYIEILAETYLIYVLRPFFTNKNKELVKIPKIYFIDNGVRNFFINNFNPIHLRNDTGFLFEGYVLSELIKSGIEDIKFWQDKNKHEVDIIIDKIHRQSALEMKFKTVLKSEDLIGLKAFSNEYPNANTYIINLGLQKNIGGVQGRLPINLRF